ncbi:potassium-transporting ATPase subunit KdpA [Sphingobacterium sp. DK4209]|uniref:Potassium-transporting ATPase potassium-binding subunit n=1 Tax=Sphingobacterium zhuxiongii TaxID=2662364 RepID=A0A5Q0QIS3_9SPHI|nr:MULTISPECIES: potassium-transporting ATPase subunit KdpA [unclassified Sphingobacterium]MVZ65260.1 potassium-transporting ATPase subunit KdpA [Sphingobacterium sp. DK4209]QGA28208.1 potassium-transporting ATPase subunit KdpA [Sphingobacterium sp. dk4302]
MNTEIISIIFMFLFTVLLGLPIGRYIAKVYLGERTVLDRICGPIDRFIYKVSGINPTQAMSWKENLSALLTVNLVWLFLSMLVLMIQHILPLNPDHNPGMSPDLAFNTAISFVVNCNLQHYSGESGLSYLSQGMLMFLQFVSAGVGMAAAAMLFRAFREKQTQSLGNFYQLFVKSCTRILLPIAILIASLLVFQGTPMTYQGKQQMISLEGDTVDVSTGPVAAFVSIKHLGTNGGGFFGANSNHPFENPSFLTNMTEMIAQFIIPIAMIFAFGYYIQKKKFAWVIFAVMTLGFLCLAIPTVQMERAGNPAIAAMGINQESGAMEGKDIRIGAAAAGFWSIVTTVISTGSINSMHDSSMALSGMNQLLGMMINAFYGGCGVGILNFFVFIILAVFISGLMVGRTPEFMGKKVDAKEMKIAMMIALLHPFLILVSTAMASYYPSLGAATTNNPGFHGFSEILYEYTSAAANNGSGFEGLADNNLWWNISTGIVLLFGRFIPIIGPVAIAGLLAEKRYIPESAGTLKTDTFTFGFMILAVILIVAALSFFPALTLGPIAEYFSLK